jgi:DNA-directed RNA polymerase specialized sigma24 family protein
MRRRKRKHVDATSTSIDEQELKLLHEVVRQIRCSDPDYLKTELIKRFAHIRAKANETEVKDWMSYLWKSLRNYALNVVRKTVRIETLAYQERIAAKFDPAARDPPQEPGRDDQIAFDDAIQEFDPKLKLAWEALKITRGNKRAAAKLLGVHRNTLSLWLRPLQSILERHGLL